jgi:hypothetical protein
MRALPAATRACLPQNLRGFKSASRSWLCQLYYRDPRLHFEVWNLGERRGLIEIGLHFESQDRERNLALLAGFSRRMVEVKASLGPRWEASRGGVDEGVRPCHHEPFSDEVLERVSGRLATGSSDTHARRYLPGRIMARAWRIRWRRLRALRGRRRLSRATAS